MVAVTNLIDAGVPEATAMTVTGHVTDAVFERYHVRRDEVQPMPWTEWGATSKHNGRPNRNLRP